MEKKSFGLLSSGEEVSLYILKSGDFRTTWTDYGATWLGFTMPDKKGRTDDILLGFSCLEPYLQPHPYFGSTVGRYANRIADAKFALDGREYRLFAQDTGQHLHGGRRGFSRRLWKSEMDTIKGSPALRLELKSLDGEEGFPGNLSVACLVTLGLEGRLTLDYEAVTDRRTPLNLCNHAYFNLRGEGRGTVLDHSLDLRCSSYLPVDERLIPLKGAPRSVEAGPFDFRISKTLGRDMAAAGQGYDHCFVIDEECAAHAKPFAHLSEPETGRNLYMWTSMPGVQLYTGNNLNGIRGKNGSVYGPYGGICLETQYFPDSPNREDYPSCLAEPGKPWRHRTEYQFCVQTSKAGSAGACGAVQE